MRWFVKEFNIFSKLSKRGIDQFKQNHRTIFMNLSSMYDKDKSNEGLTLCDTESSVMKYNCI